MPGKLIKRDRKASIEVTDEPSLHEWLTGHRARFLWRLAGPDKAIEGWSINGAAFVVILYAKNRDGVGGGWDLLTSCDSIDIERTLADAETRLGIGD